MTEPQESLGSLGPFYGFQTAGLEDNIEMEILKSFLSPDAELPSNQTAPLFTQSTQTGIQAYAPQAFPANRFEVVAESGSQYPVDVFQPQGQASQGGGGNELRGMGSSSGDTPPEHSNRRNADNDDSHREKNRVAQKKFRERQKARVANNNRRLEEMEEKLERLLQEKRDLHSTNRLLSHTLQVNNTHFGELQSQQEAYQVQQEIILMDTARIYRRGLDRPDLTLEDTKQFTMESFLSIFEQFIGRYKLLLENGGMDPANPCHRELSDLVASRRLEEARIALFSRWSSATLAWNREETRGGFQPPSTTFYTHLLGKLQLTAAQQQEWLRARRRLLEQLKRIRRQREKVALSLGLLLFQNRQKEGKSPEEHQLRNSLEEEREAVLTFLYSIIDLNTTHVQEALLDVSCHPWWPCLWTLCNILASRQKKGGEPPDSLLEPDEQAKFFPTFSAAEMLREPLLARMGGLQLKRTILSVPSPGDVLAAAKAPVPKIADMRSMTVYEVMCGKHLECLT